MRVATKLRKYATGCGVPGVVGLLCLSWPAAAQQSIPPLLTDSLVGADLYGSYCAGCHGAGGKGDGPVAEVLTVPPADLTSLARRNGGQYPAALVRAALNGTRMPSPSVAHGSSEMPIWGAIFRELDAKESVAKVRVDTLVEYVRSIQQ